MPTLLRIAWLLLPLLAGGPAVWAQPVNDDCASALTLCAQQPLTGNNTGAVGIPGFCPGTNSVLWYTFTTNSQGGPVNVAINGLDCPVVAGMDNELSVIVLSGDGSCLPGSFTAVGDCTQDSVDFTMTTDSLSANTQYWVLVSGVADNGATISAQCDFEITPSGPGMDIVGVDCSAGEDVEIGEGEYAELRVLEVGAFGVVGQRQGVGRVGGQGVEEIGHRRWAARRGLQDAPRARPARRRGFSLRACGGIAWLCVEW